MSGKEILSAMYFDELYEKLVLLLNGEDCVSGMGTLYHQSVDCGIWNVYVTRGYIVDMSILNGLKKNGHTRVVTGATVWCWIHRK